MAPAEAGMVQVEVVFSPGPRQIWCRQLTLPPGSTVADALQASALLATHPQASGCGLARWGRPCAADAPLREGDRVEVLRNLKADPKESRRLRYRGQPARRRLAGAAAPQPALERTEPPEAAAAISGSRSR